MSISPYEQRQHDFAVAIAELILEAARRGFLVGVGDFYRDPRATFPYSSPRSLHKDRLAGDLVLRTSDGELIADTETYTELGEWWERRGGTWGGRFVRRDGNHFSFEWEGRK